MTPELKAAAAASKKLEQMGKLDNKKEQDKVKLLLLGAGESGKSTIFKQMKILYGADGGYGAKEKEQAKSYIFSNIFTNMKTVIENTANFTAMADQSAADEFLKLASGDDDSAPVVDATVGELVKKIWADAGFEATWKERANFQVQDALKYYVENIDRVSAGDYVPTEADILRSRVRTTGIQEETYFIDGIEFVMFDVGGQRNERKKWIHCFDKVTAVIFVAAISEYNQVLYEDNTMNRIDEALVLFEEICNSKWFKQTAMILFLNKRDLFYEKLAEVPFKVDGQRYENFQGPHVEIGVTQPGTPEFEAAYDAASNFLKQEFVAKNKQNKEIYTHITCATDTKNVEIVFNACKDIILKGNLSGSGFM